MRRREGEWRGAVTGEDIEKEGWMDGWKEGGYLRAVAFFTRSRWKEEYSQVEEQQGREGRERNGMDWEERVSVQQLNNCNVILPCFTCKYFNHDLNASKLMKGKHFNLSSTLV
jgi:hypothetical protein